MFDFGFPEFLLILVAAVFVIGPKEIPSVLQGAGRLVRRLQYVRYAFSQQFEEFMEQSDLKDIRDQVNFEATQNEEFNEEDEDENYYADVEKNCHSDQALSNVEGRVEGSEQSSADKDPSVPTSTSSVSTRDDTEEKHG